MAPPLRTAIVTGAGNGIGRAIARRLAAEDVHVVVADLDGEAAATVADRLGANHGMAWVGDCASADGVAALVAAAEDRFGRIDVFVANAGIDHGAGLDTPDEAWRRVFDVNLLSHVHAARAMVPRWLADGLGGRFVVTASAAGLLSMIGNAPYSVSKHAAVAFAEWLSLTYRDLGIVVQALCPQGVRTAMLEDLGPVQALLDQGSLAPEEVADVLWEAVQGEQFLVLPHPEVAGSYAARATDPDTWLAAMNRLVTKLGVPRWSAEPR
jgi:NAD(P)-dependent dehydrogenase (short-subunit alcohol dehydrogenase family)